MEKEPITSQGLIKIKKELEELKNIRRPKIIEAIAEARGHGDLKDWVREQSSDSDLNLSPWVFFNVGEFNSTSASQISRTTLKILSVSMFVLRSLYTRK